MPDHCVFDGDLSGARLSSICADFFPDFDSTTLAELLENFHIDPKKKVRELSKGNGEKLQIAFALARRSQIYMLDEPLSGVDPAARSAILSGILGHYAQESLMIISTHMIHELEALTDEVIIVKDGEILIHDGTEDLRQSHGCSVEGIFKELFAHV